jgi:hypothetical protein
VGWERNGVRGREGVGGKEGEMTQTLYAHIIKRKKKTFTKGEKKKGQNKLNKLGTGGSQL